MKERKRMVRDRGEGRGDKILLNAGPEASVQDPEQGVRDTGELSLEGIDDEEIDQATMHRLYDIY